MTNHFKTSWENKLRNTKIPSRFTGVDIISYEDFERNLRELDVNFPDLLSATKILSETLLKSQSFNFYNIRLPGELCYGNSQNDRPWINSIINK